MLKRICARMTGTNGDRDVIRERAKVRLAYMRGDASEEERAAAEREARKPYWSRRDRRVLLVLLTGASNLTGLRICEAAGIGSGTAYPALAKIERLGWVNRERVTGYGRPDRWLYSLTADGRAGVMEVLGLEDGSND